jgi:hypothetical protein
MAQEAVTEMDAVVKGPRTKSSLLQEQRKDSTK